MSTFNIQVTPQNNTLVIVDNDQNQVIVENPITSVVEVVAQGPQGPQGIQGIQGPSGSLSFSNSGSFSITGSLTISGSSTFNNIGPAIFSGSSTFTNIEASGSLFGTSSYSNQSLSSSYALTASFALNGGGGGSTNTGSLLTTASVNLNTITFTKGDGSTFPITVNTGSGGGGGSTFPYTGSAVITGSLVITGSIISTLGFTGSLLGTASVSITESKTITFNLGSIPTPITTGSKTNSIFYLPYSGSIKGFILTANTGSTTTLNIWKRNNLVPTSSDTIITTNKPQLINNQLTSSYSVSGWVTSFLPNDVFLINVETNTSASYISLQLITEIYK